MGHSLTVPTAGMHCIGAWRADPPGTPRGGIVVVQEIYGVNAHIRRMVEGYAATGYVAIAPALFDHAESGAELGYDGAGTARGRALAAEVGFERAVAGVASAAQAIASAGCIGVVGYCWAAPSPSSPARAWACRRWTTTARAACPSSANVRARRCSCTSASTTH